MTTKQLKIFVLVMPVLLFALAGCGDDREYVSDDKSVCEKILFTCPQNEAPFENRKGCGCEASSVADDPELRTLDGLVKNYLARRLIAHPRGQSFAQFISLDKKEEGDRFFYSVFALAREYFIDANGKFRPGSEFAAPVILEVEQTGKAYIVRDATIFSAENPDEIRANFSAENADWILASDPEKDERLEFLSNATEGETFSLGLPISYWEIYSDLKNFVDADSTASEKTESEDAEPEKPAAAELSVL